MQLSTNPLSRRRMLALAAGVCLATATMPAHAKDMVYNYADQRWEDAAQSPARRVSLSMRKPGREFQRQTVRIETALKPGSIIVDSQRKFLYYVEGNGAATRYGVGVGREGFGWSGDMKVARKAEWPGWTPPKEMIEREKANGHILPAFMAGGPDNPLGARALYLYHDAQDSGYRIHGTNQPWSIGLNMSSGCIRMMNEDVMHLYERAGPGTKVVVIGTDGAGRSAVYRESGLLRGRNILAAIFGG